VIDTTLKDATTMFMGCNFHAILTNGIIDELSSATPNDNIPEDQQTQA
jgi:hypothetical protein